MYKKTLEAKIYRTKHQVEFRRGTTVASLIADLSNVPKNAIVTDVDDACSDLESLGYTITFIEEREV